MSTELRGDGQDGHGDTAAQLMTVEPSALLREVMRLRAENTQLSEALESRIAIEQAKGILAERFGVTVDSAFTLLRHAARSNRMNIHELAAKVISEPQTPAEFGRVSIPR